MEMLLQNPLWVVLIGLTVALHVAFAVMVARWLRAPESKPAPKPPED